MHRPNQAPRRLLTVPTGGIGGENARTFFEAGVRFGLGSHDAGGNGSWDGEATWSWSPS